MASLEKYTMEFVKNVSSLMQPQGNSILHTEVYIMS